VEISVRNLLWNPGLDRNYVGGVARGERNVTLENIFKLTKALAVSSRNLFVATLTIWDANVSLSGIPVVILSSEIHCSALRRMHLVIGCNCNK
jgi:hypothetical protein